jgi:NAD(P)-dependent dehydrogenase (short-subunit alcohol dehydrogenase family)
MELADKVALVTGAGSGIGRAAALLLAREGAKVGVLGRTPGQLEETAAAIHAAGGHALALPADVSDAPAVARALDTLAATWGRLDIVFANAGINGTFAPIDELTPEEWDRTLDINLKGTFLTIKYSVPLLRQQGGAIVINSSAHGSRTFSLSGMTAYACSKAGQVAMAKMLALELARDGIRVNVICPGPVRTEIDDNTERRGLEGIRFPVAYPADSIPPLTRGELGTPEAVAELVLFLVSDASRFITGTEVWIDGGTSLLRG